MADTTHNLVPTHILLTDEQKKELLEKLDIQSTDLPKISQDDAAIEHFNTKNGDIIQIQRESKSAKTASYYRVVING